MMEQTTEDILRIIADSDIIDKELKSVIYYDMVMSWDDYQKNVNFTEDLPQGLLFIGHTPHNGPHWSVVYDDEVLEYVLNTKPPTFTIKHGRIYSGPIIGHFE